MRLLCDLPWIVAGVLGTLAVLVLVRLVGWWDARRVRESDTRRREP